MIEYICKNCNKIFNKKSNYSYHINRKIKCISPQAEKNHFWDSQNHNNDSILSSKNKCDYCFKTFSTNSNYNRHVKNCKLKENNNKLELLYKELIGKMEDQEKQIVEQNKKISMLKKELKNKKIKNVNINSNNTINITNNYVDLRAFGNEDLTHIKNSIWKKILGTGQDSIINLVKYIHFNSEAPHNSNVYVPNKNDKYAMFYDGTEWKLELKNDITDSLITKNTEKIETKYEELDLNLNSNVKNIFSEFLKNYNENYVDKLEVELNDLLYKYKNIPMKIKENNEKIVKKIEA